MKIAVVGGTGHISTPLVRQLHERGHAVIGLTRGRAATARRSGVTWITGDRSDPATLERLMDHQPDVVIDMLCGSRSEAEMLIQACRNRVARVVLSSTVDVYRRAGASFPIRESAPRGPATDFAYAVGKADAEQAIEAAGMSGAFETVIVRPAATYSDDLALIAPVLPFEHVGVFIARILRGAPIVLHGDGSSLWSSAHHEDVARAFVLAAETPEAAHRAYNVTHRDAITWNHYWRVVSESLGCGVPDVVHIPTSALAAAAPDLMEWCVLNFSWNGVYDVSAAERDLGWTANLNWEDGVARMHLRENPRPANAGVDARLDSLIVAWRRATDRWSA